MVEYLSEVKESRGCEAYGLELQTSVHPVTRCRITDPDMLEFDHRDRSKKKIKVSSCGTIQRAKIEIEQCRVLCTFCHRIKTYLEEGSPPPSGEGAVYVMEKKIEAGECQECNREMTKNGRRGFDWDHIDPRQKKASVSELAGHGYPIKTIQKEIDKCRLLCANCHRKRTQRQKRLKRLKNRQKRIALFQAWLNDM